MHVLLRGVSKRYGELTVVDGVDLAIGEGEFFTLLGPSGCGKTTLLRMVAGFASPDDGEILFGDQPMSRVPPHKRETGMVFQSYALFPQMSVFDNVAYGLRARDVPREELTARVDEMLRIVHLGALGDRLPSQLSGGQQQRVALARALVIRPRVLLMDEPLSNLDAKLRVSMREEIRRIQKELGITTLYVTHDQEEAMAVSDRIAILRSGKLQQVGAPPEIYFAPANRFTAEFMGSCNLLTAEVRGRDPQNGETLAEVAGTPVRLAAHPESGAAELTVMLRPDWFVLADDEERAVPNRFEAEVLSAVFLGSTVTYQVKALGHDALRVDLPAQMPLSLKTPGERLVLGFPSDRPVVVAA